ncbi:hypothetical protein PVAND_012240 [Polypedilum vanderplanki]|uniref:Integrase catalytic domain-containing protein n=1 Tax=Polypedilum vanderplanki TaxID=319348 RepID=A0A9J6CKZ9_POLVA|nr:hypothetical protein PVAND_012240 [Polypedilum vanderplanki]
MDDYKIEKSLNLIDKLTNENYSIWSFKMKALLLEKKVYYTIEKDKPIEDEELEGWEKDNLTALNYIILTVSNSIIIHIKKATTAKEAWKILQEEFQNSSVACKIRLYKKLFHFQLPLGGSMREHLNQMLNMFDELAALGSNMDEDMQVSWVLASLNTEYASVVTGIEAWEESRLKLANVRSLLLEDYEKKKVLQSRKNTSSVERNSKTSESSAQANFNPHKNLVCNYCKNLGHVEKNCLKLKYNREKAQRQRELEERVISKAKNDALKSIKDDSMDEWYVDSGASKHVCTNLSLFKFIRETDQVVVIANGYKLKPQGIGDAEIIVQDEEGRLVKILLKDTLYFSNKNFSNLISVYKLAIDGYEIKFKNEKCEIIKQDLRIEIKMNYLYSITSLSNQDYSLLFHNEDSFCIHQWHRMLSHRNLDDIKRLKEKGLRFKDCKCIDVCEPCIKGKLARKSFPKEASKPEEFLDLVVSDVCGPMQVKSIQGSRYFITFIEVYSGYTEVSFMKEKSEVPTKVIEYIESIKVKFGRKMKIFRSDRGTEYTNSRLQDHLRSEGIKFQSTVGYAPEQNGIAERKNRTLMEAARTMLFDSKLPKFLWTEAVNEACYNQNRLISKSRTQTPYEVYYKKEQRFKDFHIFGCDVYVMIPDQVRKKLDPKAKKGKYVGHDNQAKGYRVYEPVSRTVRIHREVVFIDKYNIGRNPIKDQVIKDYQIEESSDNIQNEDTKEDIQHEETIIKKPELSKENLQFDPEDLFELTPPEEQIQNQGINANQEEPNQNEEKDIDEEFHDAMEEQEQLPIQEPEVIQIEDEVRRSGRVTAEPRTYKQAIQSEDKDKWIAAMDQEIKSLCDNDAWCLVDLPAGRKAVGSKWVFKKKEDQEGNIIEYKARLVAQGYSQKYGEDYDEVFAPVTRSSTFRLLLAVSGRRKYYVKQFDIKTAFLNGELKEEIYLKQPPGYEINNQVLRLKKSLYGLKQAARVWNQTIHQVLIHDGFIQSQADMCFYIKNLDNKSCYLIIHVDDILIAGSDLEIISQTQATLSKHFQVKDLGTVKFFLGIAINQDEEGNFFINQENYIKKIVSEASLSDAKPSKIPLDVGYYKLEVLLEDNKEYRKLIGMLLYVSTNSRPDISSSVSILSQKVVSLSLRLSSQDPNEVIKFYSDANWAEDRRDRKSNSGHIGFVFGRAVSWACRKQVSVSLSSTEAEYIALTEATQEVLWLKNLCEDFKIDIKFPIEVKADNQSAIKMVDSHKFSNATKHIATRYHFIKEVKEKGVIQIKYVPAEDNIADMLTKALGGIKLKQLREAAGLINLE